MRTPLHAGIVLVSLLALVSLPREVRGRGEHGSRRGKQGDAAADKGKAPVGQQVAQAAPGPSGPRPVAAIRVECTDELPAPLCDVVRQAAREAASRSYTVVDPAKVEAVLGREPALRSCRREDCRVAISDQLGADKLIDVSIQAKGHSAVGTVSIYDPVAKGISGDTEIPATRREEGRLRRAVFENVDYVIGAQRLTAPLRLEVQPEGARVKIDGSDRGTVREVRLFLGTHTVRAEKLGYTPTEQTVNVTPAGAHLEVKLLQQPIPVRLEWLPNDARVLIDGDPVDARNTVVELVEGMHQVQALATPGSQYDSISFPIEVKVGMGPVRWVLPRLAQLRIRSPRGYSLRVDNQIISAGEAISRTLQQTILPIGSGGHTVTTVSWRGRQRTLNTVAVAGNRTEVLVRPPSLVPGIVLGTLGILSIITGAVALPYDGKCIDTPTPPATVCMKLYNTAIQSYVALSAGGAALLTGIIWFSVNAAEHPLFHGESAAARAQGKVRLSLTPVFSNTEGKLLVQGRF